MSKPYRWGEIVGRLDCAHVYGLVLFCSESDVTVMLCHVGDTVLVPNGNLAKWDVRKVYRSHPLPNTLSLFLGENKDHGYFAETLFPITH